MTTRTCGRVDGGGGLVHGAGATVLVQLLYHSFVLVSFLNRKHDADVLRLHARRHRPRRTCAVVTLQRVVLGRVVRVVVAGIGR